jgi:hypothetical protein
MSTLPMCTACKLRVAAPGQFCCLKCINEVRMERTTRLQPRKCNHCGWPGTYLGQALCTVCEDMLLAVANRPGLVRAHREWEALQNRVHNG